MSQKPPADTPPAKFTEQGADDERHAQSGGLQSAAVEGRRLHHRLERPAEYAAEVFPKEIAPPPAVQGTEEDRQRLVLAPAAKGVIPAHGLRRVVSDTTGHSHRLSCAGASST